VIKSTGATVAVISALLLTACGSASSIATKPVDPAGAAALAGNSAKSDATGTWVQTHAGRVDLLQLVEAKGALSGSITEVTLPASAADSLKTINLSLVGTRSKQSLSLSINKGLGVSATWTGSFAEDQIELSIPQNDGTLDSMQFARSTTGAYSADVNELQTQLDESRRAAADQAAESARQDAQDKVSAGVDALEGDLVALGAQSRLPAAAAAVSQSLVGVTNARQVALRAQYSSCSAFDDDVSAVADSVSAVGDAESKAEDVVHSVTQAVAAVQNGVLDLQNLASTLTAAGGQPDAAIQGLLADANRQQAAAKSAADATDLKVKALWQQANDVYSSVGSKGNDCTA
jgi:hypothetical protein